MHFSLTQVLSCPSLMSCQTGDNSFCIVLSRVINPIVLMEKTTSSLPICFFLPFSWKQNRSPFNNRRAPNGRSYGELLPPESDISFVSNGRPSSDSINMFPQFDGETSARVSFSELEQGFDSYQMGRRSADINTPLDLTAFESPRTSLSSNAVLNLFLIFVSTFVWHVFRRDVQISPSPEARPEKARD